MNKIWKRNIIISLIVIVILLFYISLLSNISYFDNMLEEYIDSEVGIIRTETTTKEKKTKRVRETKKIKTTIPVETTTKLKKTTTSKTTTTKTTTTTKKTTTSIPTTTTVVTTTPIVTYKPHKVVTSRYIVGTWETKMNGVKLRYTFYHDGTFIINNKKKRKYSYDKKTINGNLYLVSDNKLLIVDNYNNYKIIREFIKIN